MKKIVLLIPFIALVCFSVSAAQVACLPGSPDCSLGRSKNLQKNDFYRGAGGQKETSQPAEINQPAMQQKIEEKANAGLSRNTVPAPPPVPPASSGVARDPMNTKSTGYPPSSRENLFLDHSEIVIDDKKAGTTYENTIEVLPEITTKVDFSSRDINRILCPVDIKDVVYSKEKGLTVKIQGKNAYLKFVLAKSGGKPVLAHKPVELYVVCGDDVYSMVAYPKDIPTQIVKLSKGYADIIKKNTTLFEGMPYEKKILSVLRAIYADNIPDSFSVSVVNKSFDAFRQIDLELKRIIAVEGEGIRVKEYLARAKNDVYLKEKDFLRADLTMRTLAVSIETLNLKKSDNSRILVVEGNADGHR